MMTESAPRNSRVDAIFVLIAILILVIGAVTDNAIVMLILSAAAMVAMTVYYRGRVSRGVSAVMIAGAMVAALIAAVVVVAA